MFVNALWILALRIFAERKMGAGSGDDSKISSKKTVADVYIGVHQCVLVHDHMSLTLRYHMCLGT
jgi:hypothetical protein